MRIVKLTGTADPSGFRELEPQTGSADAALDQRVALERPRQRGSAEFAQLEDTVLRRVMQQPSTVSAPSTNLHARPAEELLS